MKIPIFEAAPFMAPPDIDTLIDRYGLDLLNEPADLVIRDGDLAATRSGDLMLNDEEFSGLLRALRIWRYSTPTLHYLFEVVNKNKHRKLELESGQDQLFEFNPKKPLHEDPARIDNIHAVDDEIAALELSSAACAGAVVMTINRILLCLRDDISAGRDKLWNTSGLLFDGCSVGSVIEASANNFRHSDEWAKDWSAPTPQQLTSIRLLAKVLKEPIAPNGARHNLHRDICPEILHLISDSDFEVLSRNVLGFANDLAKRRRIERTTPP